MGSEQKGTRELTIKTDLRCLKKEYGVRQMSRRIRISPNRRRIVHSSAPWIYRVYMIVCVHVCVCVGGGGGGGGVTLNYVCN